MQDLLIVGATVVCPEEEILQGSVLLREGRIERIGRGTSSAGAGVIGVPVEDGEGCWLLPGVIDLHNDGLEREIEPRPRAVFPLPLALRSFESRLLSHGVTSIFHSLAFMEGRAGLARGDLLEGMVRELVRLRARGSMRHFLHARYEVVEPVYGDLLVRLLEEGLVHLVSFMDHTPGQGQFRDIENFVGYLRGEYHLSREQIDEQVRLRLARSGDRQAAEAFQRVCQAARRAGVPMASHDDDCIEKVTAMAATGVVISEFPVELEAAREAALRGLHVIVGAPNLLLGGSNTGNMRALDAIQEGAADIVCSDYYPASMLAAVFRLAEEQHLRLPEAVRLVSLNAAAAVGLAGRIGSIEPGKQADLILVERLEGTPLVRTAWVGGQKVYQRRDLIGVAEVKRDASKQEVQRVT